MVQVFHLHSVEQRLTALNIGDPQLVRVAPIEFAVHQISGAHHTAEFLPRDEAGSPRMPAKVMRTDTVREQTLTPIAMVSSAWILR